MQPNVAVEDEQVEFKAKPTNLRLMSDEEAAERVMAWYVESEGRKNEDNIRCRRYRNIYTVIDADETRIQQETGDIEQDPRMYSDTYLPIGAGMVDAAAGQLYATLFPNSEYFEMGSENPLDEFASFKVTQHMRKRQREMKFKFTVYRALQAALCFDYSITLMKWKVRPGYIRKRVDGQQTVTLGGMPFSENTIKMEDVWSPRATDRPELELLDFFNCFPDYNSKNGLYDSEFFIDVYYPLIDDLFMRAKDEERPWGRYTNLDEAFRADEQADVPRPDAKDPVKRSQKPNSRRAKIYRCWTHDHMIEVWNNIPIYRQDINGMPLQQYKIYEKPMEFPGMGLLQRIERPQYDINHIINMKRDFQNLMLNPISILDEDLLPTGAEGDIHLYPGRTFISRGGVAGDKIKVMQPGIDTSQGATEEIALQMEAMEKVSGVGPNAQAAYTPGRKTARETSAVTAGSAIRVNQISEKIEETCLEPVYDIQFYLEQTMMTEAAIFRYEGPKGFDFIQVRPEDYRMYSHPRFTAMGTSYADKEIYEQRFFTGMQMAMQMPQLHDMAALVSHMWMILDPKHAHQFLRDDRAKGHNVPPSIENELMAQGHQAEVSEQNDDQEHLADHKRFQRTAAYLVWPQAFQMNMDNHIAEHEQQGQQQQPLPVQGQDESDQMRGLRGATLQ